MLWRESSATQSLFQRWHKGWQQFQRHDQLALIRAIQALQIPVTKLPMTYNISPIDAAPLMASDHSFHLLHCWGGMVTSGKIGSASNLCLKPESYALLALGVAQIRRGDRPWSQSMSEFLDIRLDTAEAESFLGELTLRLQGPGILQEIAPIIENASYQSFETESSPSGQPWAPLAAATVKQLKRKGLSGEPKILERTGAGRRSVRVVVSGNRLYVQYLDYMEFHQTGTKNMAQRRFTPSQKDIENGQIATQIEAVIEEYL